MLRRYMVAGSMAPSLAIQGALVFSGVLSARLLGPDLRGNLTLAILLPGVVAAVASLSFANAIAYFTARDRVAAPNLLATSLVLAVPIIIAAELAHLVLFWLLFGGDETEVRAAALPSLLVAPALIVLALAAAHLQGMRRFRAMNTLRVAPYVLYGTGVTACYLLEARSLSIVIWTYSLSFGIVALLSLITLRRAMAMADRSTRLPSRRSNFGIRCARVRG